MEYIRLDVMEKCGFTSEDWQKRVSKKDKVGFVAKRQLEIERENRQKDKYQAEKTHTGNKRKKKRRKRSI